MGLFILVVSFSDNIYFSLGWSSAVVLNLRSREEVEGATAGYLLLLFIFRFVTDDFRFQRSPVRVS